MGSRCLAPLLVVLVSLPSSGYAGGHDEGEPPAGQAGPSPTETASPPRAQAGAGVLLGVPLGDFGANIEGAGGFAGHFAVGLGDSLVSLGGEAAWLWYGDESRKVPLSPTIPDIIVTVNTDNAMALFHGRVRVQARQARWRPYADGLLGFNYIYTRTSIDDSGPCELYSCGSGLASTNLDDFVLSVGGGAGVMYDFGAPGGAKLDLSVRYLWGGEARYLTEGAIRRQGDQVSFDVSRSRTDMVLVYIGVAFGR